MQIHQWGGFLTSSMAINQISWLWNVLTYNLNVNHWRIATKDPIIASTHRLISIKNTYIIKSTDFDQWFQSEFC